MGGPRDVRGPAFEEMSRSIDETTRRCRRLNGEEEASIPGRCHRPDTEAAIDLADIPIDPAHHRRNGFSEQMPVDVAATKVTRARKVSAEKSQIQSVLKRHEKKACIKWKVFCNEVVYCRGAAGPGQGCGDIITVT